MREVTVEAHDFAGGTHFRSEQHVYGLAERRTEALERKHGFLDGNLLAAANVTTVSMRQQQAVIALLLDGFAGHNAGRGLGQCHTGRLGCERHGTGGTRVRLDNVQGVGHEGVLHVDQALHATALGDGIGAFAQTADLVIGKGARRQSACGVTGMHASFLNMFHNAADIQLFAIEQGVDVDFHGILQELVDQQRRRQTARNHGIGLSFLQCAIHILAQLGVVVHDFHAATAKHVARAHQHRITDVMSRLTGFVKAQSGAIARRVHLGLLQHFAEELTVFSQIDGFRRGTENRNTGSLQTSRQRQRGLATELNDNALDRTHLLFGLVDFEYVFEGKRLEVQTIGHVVIGGHGFRVAVDHDGVIVLAQLLHGMYAGVVELDALADTVRTGAENDHGFTLTRTQFTFVRIAGVIVRRDRVEFGSAGIDRLENRTKIIRPTQFADRVFAFVAQVAQVCDLKVGKTCQLRLL